MFLNYIKDAHRGYEEMMQRQEDRPRDPNHQNVIDISSESDYGGDEDLSDFDADEESLEERSQYFHTSAAVDAFNARRMESLTPLESGIADDI